ncbi:MAG: rhomboid family intramembrane serine protease [Clostridiales bacterium]|nr:rhomboid family intramembrane serine protease [Clostridiales bacterium]
MMQRQEEHRYITPVNITFAVINVVVFVVLEILGDTSDAAFMLQHGAMYPPAVLYGGEWYRLVTSAFLHFGISHLINNMVLLVCLGSYLERAYGKVRFLIFYLVCAVGSSLVSMGHMLYTQELAVSGGASGVIFGMIGALLFLVLKNKGRFEDLSLRRFLLMMALSLYYGFSTTGVDNAAHVGGLLVGFLMGVLCGVLGKK